MPNKVRTINEFFCSADWVAGAGKLGKLTDFWASSKETEFVGHHLSDPCIGGWK